MTNSNITPSLFFSYIMPAVMAPRRHDRDGYSTLLGLLAGIMITLIYTIFFNQPSQFTPIISLMLATMISKLSAPKHLAGLGALIGIPAGIVAGIQFILPSLGKIDEVALITAYFSVSFIMIYWTAYFIFLGFLFAQLIKLYKRGSLF